MRSHHSSKSRLITERRSRISNKKSVFMEISLQYSGRALNGIANAHSRTIEPELVAFRERDIVGESGYHAANMKDLV